MLQAVNDAFQKLNKMLAPARLKDVKGNIVRLALYCEEHRLNLMSPQDLLTATKALLTQLDWAVEPAALRAYKEMGKIATIKSPLQSENEFAQKKAAGEEADAYSKQQAEAEKQIALLIENFTPINKRGVDYALKERVQKSLREQAAKHKANGVDMQKVADATANEIQRVYRQVEKASERV